MRRAETLSVSLAVPFEQAWDFLSDPRNLHRWTVDFATAPPQPTANDAVFAVQTARGSLELFVRCDQASGVIDFHFGRGGQFRCSPSRLIRNDDGCIYVFTQFEPPGAAPGLFETLVANVRQELKLLRELLEHGHDQ